MPIKLITISEFLIASFSSKKLFGFQSTNSIAPGVACVFQKGYLKTQATPGAIELVDWNPNNFS